MSGLKYMLIEMWREWGVCVENVKIWKWDDIILFLKYVRLNDEKEEKREDECEKKDVMIFKLKLVVYIIGWDILWTTQVEREYG